jgi:hypothetical protein
MVQEYPFLRNAKMQVHPLTGSPSIHWEAKITTKGKRDDLHINLPADVFRLMEFKPGDEIRVLPEPNNDSIKLQRNQVQGRPGQMEFEKKIYSLKIKRLNEKIKRLKDKKANAQQILEALKAKEEKEQIEPFIKQQRKLLYNITARLNAKNKELEKIIGDKGKFLEKMAKKPAMRREDLYPSFLWRKGWRKHYPKTSRLYDKTMKTYAREVKIHAQGTVKGGNPKK